MKPININREYYAMASSDKDTVEISMYGDVVEEWPEDIWTGQKLEGSYITLAGFMEDLERVSKAKNINIRMNSYGGDCVVAFVIHNRLRELSREGKHITGIVDGVAMSAGSIIMAACDTVQVNPASLIMIHRCWSFLYGGYNADDLTEQAEAMAAYDKAIASAYERKTGLTGTVLLHMMSETTYLTGKEAVEKGFADELIEGAEPLQIAASADGRALYIRGREVHLAPGMFAPDNIPTKEDATTEDKPVEADIPEEKEKGKGGKDMTMEELRTEHPELLSQTVSDEVAAAVKAEQDRIRGIDEVASLFADDLVLEAKYGESSCNAEQLAYRAALRAKQQGTAFLAQLQEDADEAGVEDIPAAPAPDEVPEDAMTEEQRKAKAESIFKTLLGKKEE